MRRFLFNLFVRAMATTAVLGMAEPVTAAPLVHDTRAHAERAGAVAGSARADTSANPPGRSPRVDAVRTLWEQYIVAQKRFEYNMYRVCIRKWPELDTQFRRRRDRHLARIEMRSIIFQHVSRLDPGRIVVDGQVRHLDGFPWSRAESDTLASHNPLYAQMRDFLRVLDSREQNDPRSRKMHALLKERAGDRDLERVRQPFEQYVAGLDHALQSHWSARARNPDPSTHNK